VSVSFFSNIISQENTRNNVSGKKITLMEEKNLPKRVVCRENYKLIETEEI